MSARSIFFLILFATISLCSCSDYSNLTNPVNDKIHTFYYGWWGNPEIDGKYDHWNHHIVPHGIDTSWNNAGSYPGGDDIGANFYPQLGCYSSNDPEVINTHMKQIRNAGIGVVVLSWWGKDSFTDKSISTYLDIAQKHGLKIAFHIEPIYKTSEEFKAHIEYISQNYISHPAIYKIENKPLYYIYDSFKLNYRQWNSITP